MKSRVAILMMLVLGMLLSTAGAGLAITGLSGNGDASIAAYPPPTGTSPSGGGGVLGDQDSGSDVLPEEGASGPSGGGSAPGSGVQPARQTEAGAGSDELPFTGFAAIPILLGGLALLSVGLVLRRRTADNRD